MAILASGHSPNYREICRQWKANGLMAFRFEKASCVVAGTFNMYILHPKWLAKHGIVEKGTEVGVETNFSQPGFRFTFPKLEVRWLIAPHRVVVESQNASVDCGAFIANILKALPETPLQGLGNNVFCEAEVGDVDQLPAMVRDFPQQPSPGADESVAQRTLHMGVKRHEHELTNIQLSFTEKNIELACNVHTGLETWDDANQVAIAAANRFFEDQARAKALAQHFFGTTFSP